MTPRSPDFADLAAPTVLRDWLPNIGDPRTVLDLVAEGIRYGYVLGFAARDAQ